MASSKASREAVEAVLPRLRSASLADQTTRALLDAILERRFPDNRLPPEPELADMLNVSRTTLRAALHSLESIGMVSRTPGRGTVIRTYVGRESIVLQRLIGFRDMLRSTHKTVEVVGHYARADRPGRPGAERAADHRGHRDGRDQQDLLRRRRARAAHPGPDPVPYSNT